MGIRRDYIIDQIEKAVQLVAALFNARNLEFFQNSSIDHALAQLTGLDISWFTDEQNVGALGCILSLLPDDNVKTMAAKLLEMKDSAKYLETRRTLLANINMQQLDPLVREMIKGAGYFGDVE